MPDVQLVHMYFMYKDGVEKKLSPECQGLGFEIAQSENSQARVPAHRASSGCGVNAEDLQRTSLFHHGVSKALLDRHRCAFCRVLCQGIAGERPFLWQEQPATDSSRRFGYRELA